MKGLKGLAVLSLVLLSFLAGVWYHQTQLSHQIAEQVKTQLEKQAAKPVRLASTNLVEPPKDFVEVAREVTQSVVGITNVSSVLGGSGGSGVIISTDGYIITNYHVIEGANRVEVTLPDNQQKTAKIIGTDLSTDLALLKVRASGLKPMHFGNSDIVQVGEWVLAIGNPFELESTVTAGIVSAKARNIDIVREAYSIESFIQTDAAVNPGNSGGALVNSQGELIGINSAIMSDGGSFEGYSFAIPVNLVKKVITDLREFGTVKRALLGISIATVDFAMAEKLKLPEVAGVFIRQVYPGSSAEEAGLEAGDVIIGVNGIITGSVPELQEQVALFRPGDSISLAYIRNGEVLEKKQVLLKGLEEITGQ